MDGADLQAHFAMHQPCGGGTEQDGTGRRLLGEPGGALRRVPHRGVGQAPIVAQAAEEYPPRMQPLAYDARLAQWPRRIHVYHPEALLQPQRRPRRPPGVILLRHRGPEQHQNPVVQQVLEGPPIALHFLQAGGEKRLQHLVPHLRLQALHPLGSMRERAHQDRDQFLLPRQETLMRRVP